ncbi:DUF58 domain-containing protein [Nannocystaceae bacterium ST9]
MASKTESRPRARARSRKPKTRLGKAWARGREFLSRAIGVFPLTWLGLLITAGCAWALFDFGLARIDLVLLVIGAVGLGIGVVALLATLLTAALLGLRHRRKSSEAPIDIECGYPVPTGFTLPRMWWMPFVAVTWTWLEPEAKVRIRPHRLSLREEVIASHRGHVSTIVRELEIGDIFGLTRMRLRLREQRKVRFVPSVGQLERVDVIRGMAGGEDISHPDGPQEGELYDLRHYTPGDPIRFVLWKVFARSRQLVVRSPERALSPIRQTCAYLVAGEGDEPAAGAARLAVMHGSLGNDWVLGADGSHEDANRRDQAVDLLARSANTAEEQCGRGLGDFLKRRGSFAGSVGRAVVFVPGRPGPWLDAVLDQCRGATSRGGRIEFVIGTDGIVASPPKRWFSRLAVRERSYDVVPGAVAPVTTEQVGEVVKALSSAGRVIVVDRMAGRMFADGHLGALTKAASDKSKSRAKPGKSTSKKEAA